MKLENYIEEIKLELTGGLTHLELPDASLAAVVNRALREVQRYIDLPKLITVPYAQCIDLSAWKHSAVVKVYRTSGYTGNTDDEGNTLLNDPMYMQQWMIFSNGGSMYNLNNYLMNFMSYNSLLQIRNTVSTDLAFKESDGKLYINCAYDAPTMVTIEYIPLYQSVEEIDDPYWTDIIQRLSVALAKIALGRIRSKYKQSNALWTLDGDQLLTEGNNELNDLRTQLKDNMPLTYPVD